VLARVAQVDGERFEVVGEAGGRRRVPLVGELADERAQPALAVLLRAGLVERLPVGGLDALALSLVEPGSGLPRSTHPVALVV